MSTHTPFPLFLKLTGRRCVVVGGNCECEQKALSLVRAGASVIVIADQATAALHAAHSDQQLTLHLRPFRAEDLNGATIVVAQHPDQAVNEEVSRLATERGILCNVVDQPALCHFYYPAIVQRGDLQIAISTNGLSPALASSIRAELEQRFSPLYAEWIRRLGRVRARILRRQPKSSARTTLLQQFATRSRFARFEQRFARKGGI